MTAPSLSRTCSTRLSPSIASTATPSRRSIPLRRWSSAQRSPISSPSTRPSGTGSASTSVTSAPRPRAVAATSEPMKPAPTTTRRAPCRSASRIARPSSSVRSVCRPSRSGAAGSVRGRAPVAMMSPSNGTAAPPASSTVRAWRSSPVARSPSRSSTSSARSSSTLLSCRRSGSHSPASSCLESGGRSYGACASSPISTIGPAWPSRRRLSTARCPARDAPTTAMRSRAATAGRSSRGRAGPRVRTPQAIWRRSGTSARPRPSCPAARRRDSPA